MHWFNPFRKSVNKLNLNGIGQTVHSTEDTSYPRKVKRDVNFSKSKSVITLDYLKNLSTYFGRLARDWDEDHDRHIERRWTLLFLGILFSCTVCGFSTSSSIIFFLFLCSSPLIPLQMCVLLRSYALKGATWEWVVINLLVDWIQQPWLRKPLPTVSVFFELIIFFIESKCDWCLSLAESVRICPFGL